jgi:hypothetical protein
MKLSYFSGMCVYSITENEHRCFINLTNVNTLQQMSTIIATMNSSTYITTSIRPAIIADVLSCVPDVTVVEYVPFQYFYNLMIFIILIFNIPPCLA